MKPHLEHSCVYPGNNNRELHYLCYRFRSLWHGGPLGHNGCFLKESIKSNHWGSLLMVTSFEIQIFFWNCITLNRFYYTEHMVRDLLICFPHFIYEIIWKKTIRNSSSVKTRTYKTKIPYAWNINLPSWTFGQMGINRMQDEVNNCATSNLG